MRILLRAAILIIGHRGISAIVLNETPSSASSGNGAAAAPAPSFPVTLSSAYALQFAQAFLSLSPNNATQRARELAAFIPVNGRALQPQFGWNGAGIMQLESEQVAGVDVRSAHTAASGEPAWLPAPPAVSPPHPTAASDPAAVSFGSIASVTVPPAGATRDIAVTVNRVLYGQVSPAAPQLAATYDMSVIDKPGRRWYAREIRASTQPMGTQ